MKGLVGWLTIVGICLSLPMCGSSSGDFCDAKCNCQGCSSYDYDNCVRDYDWNEEDAARRGCSDLWDAYVDCVSSGYGCRGRDFDDGCGPEKDRWRNCAY